MQTVSLADLNIRALASSMGRVQPFRAGELIFRQGDVAEEMYVVMSGQVAISSNGQTIEVIQPGDGMGIVSLIDGKRRSTEAVAHTDCELAAVSWRKFRFMVEEVPNFCWYVMDELAQRVRAASNVL